MPEPLVVPGGTAGPRPPLAADGRSFSVHEWGGDGPPELHVHHEDDEAWHVLEGALSFRFLDREVLAPAGSTVFVPAGVAHTYRESGGPARYLVVLTPRLRALVAALHAAPPERHAELMREHATEVVPGPRPG
jgi:mannose-6-phosphate isomerase-like protein (cupin superfamily)